LSKKHTTGGSRCRDGAGSGLAFRDRVHRDFLVQVRGGARMLEDFFSGHSRVKWREIKLRGSRMPAFLIRAVPPVLPDVLHRWSLLASSAGPQFVFCMIPAPRDAKGEA